VKGFVPTPDHVVDAMVAKLFDGYPPSADSTVLDPGCGTGAFIQGIARWCRHKGPALPKVVGIESDPRHVPEAQRNAGALSSVTIRNEDFLAQREELFDYIIGNPPYVPITGLSDIERSSYRKRYRTAIGRFDLYLLFFEQALRLLKPGGRLVFITPEKFLYVRTAEPLRRALARLSVEEIHLADEATFEGLVTYPTITTLVNAPAHNATRVIMRDGTAREVHLSLDGSSWLPTINGRAAERPEYTLADVCLRISCGVATGADSVYVAKTVQLPAHLRKFAFPTIAGREIREGWELTPSHSMLVPYAKSGALLREEQLGRLGDYLRQPELRGRLLKRTCVAHKQWYAFHENPPLADILRPKILCKDITSGPFFLVDEGGAIVPRHSVYYIVPNEPSDLLDLCEYLNSAAAQAWLRAHCQRAANGFLRLQSHVLKKLPVPASFVAGAQGTCFAGEVANH
jgi:adenine-specific DNA-methyltransferase